MHCCGALSTFEVINTRSCAVSLGCGCLLGELHRLLAEARGMGAVELLTNNSGCKWLLSVLRVLELFPNHRGVYHLISPFNAAPA